MSYIQKSYINKASSFSRMNIKQKSVSATLWPAYDMTTYPSLVLWHWAPRSMATEIQAPYLAALNTQSPKWLVLLIFKDF